MYEKEKIPSPIIKVQLLLTFFTSPIMLRVVFYLNQCVPEGQKENVRLDLTAIHPNTSYRQDKKVADKNQFTKKQVNKNYHDGELI